MLSLLIQAAGFSHAILKDMREFNDLLILLIIYIKITYSNNIYWFIGLLQLQELKKWKISVYVC